jgi:uncharacterized protein YcbX
LQDEGGPAKVDEALERSFRPNFVVYGDRMAAHDEDAWEGLELLAPFVPNGQLSPSQQSSVAKEEWEKTCDRDSMMSVRFQVTGACARCSMVNVHPSRGDKDPATLRMLASYRKEGSNIFFGQYLAYDRTVQRKIDSVGASKRLVVEEGTIINVYYK